MSYSLVAVPRVASFSAPVMPIQPLVHVLSLCCVMLDSVERCVHIQDVARHTFCLTNELF